MTELIKAPDLKLPSAFIVGNIVICNKIVNRASLRTMIFLNINQKGGPGFRGVCRRCGKGVAIGPMSADPRERFKIFSYDLKQPWGGGGVG